MRMKRRLFRVFFVIGVVLLAVLWVASYFDSSDLQLSDGAAIKFWAGRVYFIVCTAGRPVTYIHKDDWTMDPLHPGVYQKLPLGVECLREVDRWNCSWLTLGIPYWLIAFLTAVPASIWAVITSGRRIERRRAFQVLPPSDAARHPDAGAK